MKNIYLKSLACFLLFQISIAKAEIISIEDANFKSILLSNGTDQNHDLEIDRAEAELVHSLILTDKGIHSLKGIEAFENLRTLHCSQNYLLHLDLRYNEQLIELNCDNNQLESLKLHDKVNASLKYLSCVGNPLSYLIISNNQGLLHLACGKNLLKQLYTGKNYLLNSLSCYSNQLTALELSKNGRLRKLSCADNLLQTLEVNQNVQLDTLYCYKNLLTSLDLVQNTHLKTVDCHANSLSGICVSSIALVKPFWKKDSGALWKACADTVHIPDPVFKAFLLGYGVDQNSDGKIQVVEAEATTYMYIYVPNHNIYDLKGIESFTALTYLSCQSLPITSID